jgi:phospholipid N-methyltransferase
LEPLEYIQGEYQIEEPTRHMKNRFAFFREFLKHPLQIGWIVPSSRFLERSITEAAGVRYARTIIELGPGTGGTTRAILKEMPHHARLLSIEINPHLHRLVCRIQDDRLITHLGNAQELKEIISMHGLDAPDSLISGIPFSTIGQASGSHLVEAIYSVLAPGGRFVAYQMRKQVASVCNPFLGKAKVEFKLLNIPPVRIYRWQKHPG